MESKNLSTPPRESTPRFHKDILELIKSVFPDVNEVYSSHNNIGRDSWKTIPLAQLRLKLLEEFSEYSITHTHNQSEDRRFEEAIDVLLVALFVAYREKECTEKVIMLDEQPSFGVSKIPFGEDD